MNDKFQIKIDLIFKKYQFWLKYTNFSTENHQFWVEFGIDFD